MSFHAIDASLSNLILGRPPTSPHLVAILHDVSDAREVNVKRATSKDVLIVSSEDDT